MEYKWLIVAMLWLNHVYSNDYELIEDSEVEEFNPPYYEFKYGVKDTQTGDIKNQWEVRKGDNVKGEYSVVEPDGTVRKVQYSADKHNGFNAIVTREGKSRHPVKVTRTLSPEIHDDIYYEPSFYTPKHTFSRVRTKPDFLPPRGVAIQASGSSKREEYVSPEVPPNHSPIYTGLSNYNKLLQMYRKFREENSNTRKHKFDYGINEYFENGYVALNYRIKNSKVKF